jgi:hypothetical protein
MRLRPSSPRRLMAVAAVICAAALAPLAASGAVTTAGTPTCATSGLVIWLDTHGSGTAGSTYYKLGLTNLSGRACTLFGYPGVSAVNLGRRQLGSAASRDNAHERRTVTLARGATATAVLRIADAQNFPSSVCRQTMAAGLRVYPPNQKTAKVVPFPFLACSRAGPVFMSVRALQKA